MAASPGKASARNGVDGRALEATKRVADAPGPGWGGGGGGVVSRARAVERRLEGLLAVEVAAERLRIMAETLGHQTAAGNLRLKLELHVRSPFLRCKEGQGPSERQTRVW